MKKRLFKKNIRRSILKNGMAGLIGFFNSLSQEVHFVNEDGDYALNDVQIKIGSVPQFIILHDDPNENVSLTPETLKADESKIKDAGIGFLRSVFEEASIGRQGLWYRARPALLKGYDENDWNNLFGKPAKADFSLDSGDIYWCSMVFRLIKAMVKNGLDRPALISSVRRTDETRNRLGSHPEEEFHEIVQTYFNKPLPDDLFAGQETALSHSETIYNIEPLNHYAAGLNRVKFYVHEISNHGDPDLEYNKIDGEKWSYVNHVEDFFNMNFLNMPDLMVQLFFTYVVESQSIERIKFCKNREVPTIECENMLFEKTKSRGFCSENCRKRYYFENQPVEDQEKYSCRRRQRSSLENMSNTLSKKESVSFTPLMPNKDLCEACTQDPKNVKGRQCQRVRENNPKLFERYENHKNKK